MLATLRSYKLDAAALLLRVGLAAIFVVHGYVKVHQHSPLDEQLLTLTEQRLVGWAELVCGIALLVGLLSRFAALGIVAVQIGAIVLVTGSHAMQGLTIRKLGGIDWRLVGPEYNLVLITMAVCVLILGSGAFSLDRVIWNYWQKHKAAAGTPQPVLR
jgi:putative oxidoreductase